MHTLSPLTRNSIFALALLSISTMAAWGQAQDDYARPASTLIPVSEAKDGISADLGYRLRQGFSSRNAYYTLDENLYYNLHWEEFIPHNLLRRSGPVRELDHAVDDRVGRVRAQSTLGNLELDELIADPRSRIQGWVVVHEGKIVYEQYPGMEEDDHHLWYSSSKSVAGLLVGLLEADDKIDVNQSIDFYLPELAVTNWKGIPIIDILDMASGLDLHENNETRINPGHSVGNLFSTDLLDRTGLGTLTANEILFGVRNKLASGEIFEYSSLNSKMLGVLVERVSGQRVADFISDRVWSKMGAEGDGLLGVDLWGGAAIYGMISSRLRDKARYGMLYTPSWQVVADEQVVPPSLMDKIRDGCRPELYERALQARPQAGQDPERRCNSRQWDAVYVDGDMFKGGARGQGIYVSPRRDVVVAFFSTTPESGWLAYARAIAKALVPES